jgi:hypothetical protein
MNSWPEYDEQVALLRSRLVDTYWDAAPAWYREDVVGYYRAARRWRMRDWWVVRFVVAPTSAVMIADASFPLGQEGLLGGANTLATLHRLLCTSADCVVCNKAVQTGS